MLDSTASAFIQKTIFKSSTGFVSGFHLRNGSTVVGVVGGSGCSLQPHHLTRVTVINGLITLQ
jgi:hypothetical protein